jgi:hypothetical protein
MGAVMADEFTEIVQAIADEPSKQQMTIPAHQSSLRYSPELMVDIIINNSKPPSNRVGMKF